MKVHCVSLQAHRRDGRVIARVVARARLVQALLQQRGRVPGALAEQTPRDQAGCNTGKL